MKRLLWPVFFAMMLAALVLPGTSRAQGPDQDRVPSTSLDADRIEEQRRASPYSHRKVAAQDATAAAPLGKELPMDSRRIAEQRKRALSASGAKSPAAHPAAPSAPAAGNGIYGTVTINGQAANNIPLQLQFWDGSSYTTRQQTVTQSDGSYEFLNVPSLGASQSYYVRFVNSMKNTNWVSGWYSYDVDTFTAGTNVAGGDFDISNITLTSPVPGATATLPTTFQWGVRSAMPTDSYMVELYDPNGTLYWDSPAQGYVGSFSLGSLPNGLSYDILYGWYVLAAAPDGGVGASYYAHAVILSPPGIYGRVTKFGDPAANVTLALRFWNGNRYLTAATTKTRINGTYTFPYVSSLGAGQSYYVRYVNLGDSDRIGAWFSYDIETYTEGTNIAGGDFDISNIPLYKPTAGARAVMPVTFQWGSRPATWRDSYVLQLFNLIGTKFWLTPPLGYSSAYRLEKLPPGFTYGVRYAWAMLVLAQDGGMGMSYWAYVVTFARAPLPAAFVKTSPANGAAAQPLNVNLNWASSARALSYEYCYDRTNDNVCTSPAQWIQAGTNLSATIGPLAPGATYFWQARAVNWGGATMANGGTWWSFKTQAVPGAFSKSYPLNLSVMQSIAPTLQWGASTSATGYEYCIDTTEDNSCEGNNWVSTGTARSASLSNLARGTTYFWQVRATNSLGTTEASAGAWWKFTTAQNLLKNASFETDANADGRPDNWTSNTRFTRSSEQVQDGSYVGRFYAKDNSGASIGQAVGGIKPGKLYHFAGWVNIPDTTDAFTFALKIKWRNSLGAVIGTTNLKTYSAPTAAWEQLTADATAPASAARAEVVMVATSLNATVYVDNLELWW